MNNFPAIQLVAKSSEPSNIIEVMSRLGRGQPPCAESDLTPECERDLRRHSCKRRGHFAGEIKKALEAGQTRIARKRFNKMLRSTSVRMAALIEANLKQARAERARARHEGRDASVIEPMDFASLCALLPETDIFGRAASARLAFIPKTDGELRPVTSSGLADRACGILLKHALIPFARAHPRLACQEGQYMLAGGAHTACDKLKKALEQAPQEAVFVQIDVKRFYEHISIEHLSQFTGLSQTIIRGFISAGDMVKRGAYRQWEANRSLFTMPIEVMMPTAGSTDAGGVSRHVDRCIAPGSAVSSIVGEMVMGHVLRDVCARIDGCPYLASYSDNIGILAPTEAAASAFVVAVRDVLHGHPAGPFQVSKWSQRRVDRGFSYLGYRFERSRKGVVVHPRSRALERFFFHHSQSIQEAMQGDFIAMFGKLRDEVEQFASAFALWEGREDWRADQDAELFSFLVVHCREIGRSSYTAVQSADWPKVRAAETLLDATLRPFSWTALSFVCRGIPVPTRERAEMLGAPACGR